jgi:8-oxo-dGTP diphosphatase
MPFTYDYPRPAVTVDVAIVTREPKPRVLLIRRKQAPFAGSWAIPGGFIDMEETLEESARRELREETGVETADLEQMYTFGDPGRDPRGRTVTVAYLARVNPDEVRPVAADDADEVGWFPLDALPPVAFDHEKVLTMARDHVKQSASRAQSGARR